MHGHFFIPFILVATFTMLNLFIAIIVNAMQSYHEAEQHDAKEAVDAARKHIEADLHAEMRPARRNPRTESAAAGRRHRATLNRNAKEKP
jgi:voltage-gated sodium channel